MYCISNIHVTQLDMNIVSRTFLSFKNGIGYKNISLYLINHIYTLSGQKYFNTTKYPCTDCAIYRLNIQLGAKMGIEIYRYQKFVVLALTLVKIFGFLTFREVLIY